MDCSLIVPLPQTPFASSTKLAGIQPAFHIGISTQGSHSHSFMLLIPFTELLIITCNEQFFHIHMLVLPLCYSLLVSVSAGKFSVLNDRETY